MLMTARVSGSSEINRLSVLIKSFHQSFVNILIESNLNRASQAGGDVTITSDTDIHHPWSSLPGPAIITARASSLIRAGWQHSDHTQIFCMLPKIFGSFAFARNFDGFSALLKLLQHRILSVLFFASNVLWSLDNKFVSFQIVWSTFSF